MHGRKEKWNGKTEEELRERDEEWVLFACSDCLSGSFANAAELPIEI
jgi:hypothetical protein